MKTSITYFEKRGKNNTDETLNIAKIKAMESGIKNVVLATTHGYSALRAAEIFAGTGVSVTAVSISPSFDDEGWKMSSREQKKLEDAGIRVITSLHGLADGVTEGLYGEITPGTIIADTLRLFSQGMKVAVEISIMAMESGVISPGIEIIAVGGTEEGADTAIVARPSYARKIKNFKICEILCKPRIA
ncbi:MAG: hypothetical protein KAJ15_03650 [Spirochaetes bacterium]|nr:hypothetical protein [Spirochaetota bacterium]